MDTGSCALHAYLLMVDYCSVRVDNHLCSCWEKQEGNWNAKWISKSLSPCGRGTVVKWKVTELAGLDLAAWYFWNTKQGASEQLKGDAEKWDVTLTVFRLTWDPGSRSHSWHCWLLWEQNLCCIARILTCCSCCNIWIGVAAWASNLHVKKMFTDPNGLLALVVESWARIVNLWLCPDLGFCN